MGGNANFLDSIPFPGVCEVIGGQLMPLSNIPLDGADIWTMDYWHGNYYFGGQINTIPLGSRNIVSFDGIAQWLPLGQGIGGNHIRSIKGYGDSLYVGGFFDPGPNVLSRHIQIWDGDAWRPFFPGVVEFVSQVFDMQVYEGALYICGNFRFDPNGPVYPILRFDGHQLCAIGGPIPWSDNGCIAFFHNELYMAVGHDFPGLEYEWIGRLPLEGLVPDECYEVVTSVQDVMGNGPALTAYPNPATDHVTIGYGTSGYSADIIIRDASGRAVTTTIPVRNGQADIDVRSWAPGFYVVEMMNNGQKRFGRFMKR